MQDAELKLYALYLKDLQTMGTRQEHMRKYYITLISAVFTILSLGGETLAFKATPDLVWLVSVFGVLLCVLWLVHMVCYRSLFKVKFAVLKQMELKLPFQPFTDEGTAAKARGWKHFQMTWIDIGIPVVFIFLFCALPFLPRVAQP